MKITQMKYYVSYLWLIIDVDGFSVSDNDNTKFLTKELGIFDFRRKHARLLRFRLHRTIRSLKDKDRRTANYVTRYIHGMKFKDYRREINERSLTQLFKEFSMLKITL